MERVISMLESSAEPKVTKTVMVGTSYQIVKNGMFFEKHFPDGVTKPQERQVTFAGNTVSVEIGGVLTDNMFTGTVEDKDISKATEWELKTMAISPDKNGTNIRTLVFSYGTDPAKEFELSHILGPLENIYGR
jgi:hypothetical protein